MCYCHCPVVHCDVDCVQSPDGKYIACGAIDGIIYIFEVVSEKLIHTLEGELSLSSLLLLAFLQCFDGVGVQPVNLSPKSVLNLLQLSSSG